MKSRVVIIGAGVAGLTTAYRLARSADVEILILEKDPEPGGRVRTRALPSSWASWGGCPGSPAPAAGSRAGSGPARTRRERKEAWFGDLVDQGSGGAA